MKLRVFQSDKGDCLLLEAATGELVLCDGGIGKSMKERVRAELGQLHVQGREIEYVYVSHVDNDHINGVLELLGDAWNWKQFDSGQADSEPEGPRPPVIKGVLHNGFKDQLAEVDMTLEKITQAAAAAPALEQPGGGVTVLAAPSTQAMSQIVARVTDIPESLELDRLIAPDRLNIPLNKLPRARAPRRLLYAGHPRGSFQIGTMTFTLLGPTKRELESLKTGWINFLKEEGDALKERLDELDNRIVAFDVNRHSESGFSSRDWHGVPAFENVTVPNIASLMFMVEERVEGREEKKTLLLTGDGHQTFILAGLERTGFLEKGGKLHINVLKVQHHGSERNLKEDFAQRVTADHYVFCGNGEHENPDLGVIDIVFNSRQGPDDQSPFEFWFSTTPNLEEEGETARFDYFVRVQAHVADLQEQSGGRLTVHYNEGVGIDLPI